MPSDGKGHKRKESQASSETPVSSGRPLRRVVVGRHRGGKEYSSLFS